MCVCVCVCVCWKAVGRMDVKPDRTLCVCVGVCVGVCLSEGSWQDGCETKQDPVGLLGTEAFLCSLLLACK